VAARIVVAGAMGQKPRHGGHAWVFLQYLLGFRRLGFDVLFVDRLDGSTSIDAKGRPAPPASSWSLARLARVMAGFDLGASFAVLGPGPDTVAGPSRARVRQWIRGADVLVNVMGFLRDPDLLEAAPMRVFLDIDPGYGQMWRSLGLHDALAGHDRFVTIAGNIGRPWCSIPTGGLPWVVTRPPVVLERWPYRAAHGDRFSTVATWRGAYGPLDVDGIRYGQRVHEFRRFIDVPRRAGVPMEIALHIDPAEERDLRALREGGWSLTSPTVAAGDPWRYRGYVRRSAGEFAVAKEMYVRTRGGWFSDRSACYLATGRPVIVQDTGLNQLYPTGKGLLTFSTPDQAVECLHRVLDDLPGHSSAARGLAETHFDSDIVLGQLLADLGVA
jgi:hypothetical protein